MAVARNALWLEMAPQADKPYCWKTVSSKRFSTVPQVGEPHEWLLPGPFGMSRAVVGQMDGQPVLLGLYFAPEPSPATAGGASGAVRTLLDNLWREKPRANARLRLLLTGTPLQVAVWQALAAIPAGETRSYSEVARMAGYPRAIRAAASAVGSNPVSWLIPCHRVIRIDGGLGGYGWGLDMKRAMLDCEGVAVGG